MRKPLPPSHFISAMGVRPKGNSAGFTLVEVVLAIAVCGFCLILIVGLIAGGLVRAHESFEETRASNLLAGIIAERRILAVTSPCVLYPLPALQPAGAATGYFGLDDNGQSTGTTLTSARYRVDYTIVNPLTLSETPYQIAVRVSWPANAATPKEYVESLATYPQP